MPQATWSIEEQRDALLMRSRYILTSRQVWDIMGRIWGEVWRRQTNPDRKKYTLKDIRDEISSRWLAGHRHHHFEVIDPESGAYDAAETAARAASDARIRTAANQMGGRNWLREDHDGNLPSPNVQITLTLQPTPYSRPPSTFNRAFQLSQQQKAASSVSGSRATTSSSTHAGAAISTTRARHTHNTPNLCSAESSRTAMPRAPPTGKARAPSSRVSKSQQTFKLPMYHGKDLEVEESRMVLPNTNSGSVRAIDKKTKIYEYGGEVVRVWDLDNQRIEDVLVCDADICARCCGAGRSGTLTMKVRRSPFDGLPFVHLGRDTIKSPSGQYIVHQTAPAACEEVRMLPHRFTAAASIVCQSGGDQKLVAALGCISKDCDVCSPASADQDYDEEFRKQGGLYCENDLSEHGIDLDDDEELEAMTEVDDEKFSDSEVDAGELDEDEDEFVPA